MTCMVPCGACYGDRTSCHFFGKFVTRPSSLESDPISKGLSPIRMRGESSREHLSILVFMVCCGKTVTGRKMAVMYKFDV